MKRSTENRPKIKIPLTKSDIFFEIASAIGLIVCWLLPALMFKNLPDTIPTHFGLNGKPDDWGNKASIFILPAILTLVYFGISVLNKFPHIFNYPVQITAENAAYQYTKASRIIRLLKLLVVILFLFIEWQVCSVSINSNLPSWFLPIVIAVPVILPIAMAFILTKKPSPSKK